MAKLTINGEEKSFDGPADMPLLWVLCDIPGMTGTKFDWGVAQRGARAVRVDGKSVGSCMLPAGAVRDRGVKLIEGIGKTDHPFRPRSLTLDKAPGLGECGMVETSGLRNRR